MRRRIVRVAMFAVAAALILFAVPLAVVVRLSLFDQEHRELERAALAAAVRVGPDFATSDPVELPPVTGGRQVGVYDTRFRLRAGHGPVSADAVVHRAATGVVADGQTTKSLVVAVPVSSSEQVVGVVRASVDSRAVWLRVTLAWLVLAISAMLALVGAVLVARRLARLLSQPLESLSATSARVADGDLTARAEPSAIPEIHRLAQTHNRMLDRLTQLLDRERHFSADASHQLRTPLAGLQLGLEAALARAQEDPETDLKAALVEANEQARRLHETVEEILRLARLRPDEGPTTPVRAVGELLSEVEGRWHGRLASQGRQLRVHLDTGLAPVPVPGSVADQILDVLLDNATRHGRGVVEVSAREMGGAVSLQVKDEGAVAVDNRLLFQRGTSGGTGHGIGLALARSMAEAAGGRLFLAHRSPTTFSLTFPDSGAANLSTPATREAAHHPSGPRG